MYVIYGKYSDLLCKNWILWYVKLYNFFRGKVDLNEVGGKIKSYKLD